MTENRLLVMKRTQVWRLIFISGFCSFTLGSPDFHLIDQDLSYSDAKAYCRQMHSDLASVHNATDMDNLFALVSSSVPRAWIGLESERVWKWHWSRPYQKLDFLNWRAGEPLNTTEDKCAVMGPSGEWFESDCGTQRSFVCQGSVDTGDHIFVTETKSWRDAQNHCRDLSSELVSIHSAEENEEVRNISVSQNVWIGLFKDPWKWSDGSNTSFRFWKPSQPNYLDGQDCVVAVFKNDGKWNDLRCTGKRAFVCRGASKFFPATTIKPSTQLSQTTKELPTNQSIILNGSSQVLTTTIHLILTSSNQSNITNATTEDSATTVGGLILNTTAVVLSTELINATTEMSNVTATQIPTNTTVQATTGNASATTTPMETPMTSTQINSTAQSSTLKPTGNSHIRPPGDLILIKENLTWIEATSYCRRHYVDLIHITTKDIQEQVAEKAKNATSPHVWLGLRYMCDFNFWFWTSSRSGCYQNWAPGQGSEERNDCEVSGAIEATGGQQWVSLPQTEKLNFICSTCVG